MPPRLLYFCGTFAPASGGAELSALAILQDLARDHEVMVVTRGDQPDRESRYGFTEHRVSHSQRFAAGDRLIREWQPEVILTQLLWSDVAMQLGARHRIPVVLRVCKVPFGSEYLRLNPPQAVIAVSGFVANYLSREQGTASTVMAPLIDLTAVRSERTIRESADYITMFNPVKQKGGELFLEIARRAPERRFGWVPGWDILKKEGRFDPEICAAICESLGLSFTGGVPEEVDFREAPNVVRLEGAFPPKSIYSRSRLVLVPSQWAEAFGRVALEAMANGIPVLGSEVGGLPEMLKEGGILLPKGDPETWLKAIAALDDPGYYREMGERGRRYVAEHYRPEVTRQALRTVLAGLYGPRSKPIDALTRP